MKAVLNFIDERLAERKNNSLRTLRTAGDKVDFCSNDYLGFARSDELKTRIAEKLKHHTGYLIGSTGSRLIAGNDEFTERLEDQIANFHQHEAALLFNSGYDANLGLLSSLLQRGDTIITDELIHASIIDGTRLSHANRSIFKHNDLNSLEDKLKQSTGKIYIAVESIYSMDGDEAPLAELCSLSHKYHAALIVDEAHATGIFGVNGRGLVNEAGLTDHVFARVVTFGKALGSSGAAVLGNMTLRSYLINFARSFIYTTAAPFYSHVSINQAYQYLLAKDHQTEIKVRIAYFKDFMKNDDCLIQSRSAIQSILIPGNTEAKEAANMLQNAGFDVRAIVSPTVRTGTERLRVCLHTYNTKDEIYNLAQLLKKL